MIREQRIKNVSWISLAEPTEADIRELNSRFPEIHELVLEELLTPSIRQRVENYESYLYMVLHFPILEGGQGKTVSREIDFILMPDTMITVQYGGIDPLEDFWHACEGKEARQDRYGKTPVHVLYYLLYELFTFSLNELDELQEKIDAIEERVFTGNVQKTLQEVALLKRNVLDFRRAIKPQQITLESLAVTGTHFYGEKIRPYLADLVGEHLKVWNLLENHKETLDALFETNDSLLASRMNETMRILTLLAFIGLIPSTLAQLLSINALNIPFSGHPAGFLIDVGLISAITVLIYAVLRWRKII